MVFDADLSKEVMFVVAIFNQIMEYIVCENKANIFNSGMLCTWILAGRGKGGQKFPLEE